MSNIVFSKKTHRGALTLAYKMRSYSTGTMGRNLESAWPLYGSVAGATADTTVPLTSHPEPRQ